MEFSRQEYWPGLPFPTPGDLPNPASNLHLLHWQVDFLTLTHQGSQKLPIQESKLLCPPVPVGIQGLYSQASVFQETLLSSSSKIHQESLRCLKELAGQTKTS